MQEKSESKPAAGTEKKLPTEAKAPHASQDRVQQMDRWRTSPPAIPRSLSTPPGEPYNDVLLRRQK